MLILGILFAWFTSRDIRKSLLGYEPDTFAKMFLQREEILENLTEGILAIDTAKNMIYANPSARKIFGEKQFCSDEHLSYLLKECMQTKKANIGLPYEYDHHSLLLSLMPLFDHDEIMYTLVIIRDRTETIQLAEQLTGTTHIIDALRATTHEFLNKLHIISGMLQIGEYDEAIQFIDGLSDETRNGYQTTIRQIQNKTIAALLLGKQSHARELNIQFSVQKDSYLEPLNQFLSTQELVTVIG